ncbi:hypothetical protein [Streptomyces sp. GC420]|uniref:hypothetical protein n=1 Tax=Streptomyces sp. GC420 TaxID=2697568 RepID=UPI0014152535|nr:hypothetical protein [Streptomyces sp. GC420]NBM16852.1 hypothetical protein [Streptomyces sp. GC420]
MGIFRRGPKRDSRETPRDPEYGFFSVEEGRLFRSQVRAAFAEHGLEVTVYADMVTDDSDRQFGLASLAAVCHNDTRGAKAWPGLVRDHVGMVLRAMDGPPPLETLPAEQIRAQLYPRVITEDMIEREAFRHARDVAPGLREVIALDLPESVMMLTDDALSPLGDIHELRAHALRNLRALPVEGHEVLKGADGMRFDVVMGDSFFTASRVLVLDELVRRVTGRDLGIDGALVAMPFRHQLAFHAIRGADIIPALNGMAAFAAAGFEDAVGPVSPHVYWWRAGVLSQLSDRDDEGLKIMVDEDFQELLERIVGDGDEGDWQD